MGKMNDVTDMPDPLDHDPVLDRYLARLGHYAPAPGFENRVLANVYVPAPRWLQALRERARSLVETKRVWWLAGGFAASSDDQVCPSTRTIHEFANGETDSLAPGVAIGSILIDFILSLDP